MSIGKLGERVVALWLEDQNYHLLHQNWSCRWGEIDLIALDRTKTNLIFVEVKTRSQRNWDEDGLLAVDANKQHKISRTAQLFLAKNPQLAELYCRFDVALVSYQKDSAEPAKSLNTSQPSFFLEGYQLTLRKYLESAFDYT